MTEIHRVTIQLRRPMGNDPGMVESACYVIEAGNTVILTNRDGQPLSRGQVAPRRRGEPSPLTRWERKLAPGEDAARAARQLLRARYDANKRGSDFNRPLPRGFQGGVA